MSEVMTVESIIEAEWQLLGYWTKARFAFKTEKNQWSDADVLAYHPEQKKLVIAESKVRGPKKKVFAYNEQTRKKHGTILEFSAHVNSKATNHFDFIRHLYRICSDGVAFADFEKMVDTLVVQHVSNYVIADDLKEKARECVRKAAMENLSKCKPAPPKKLKIEVQLDTTLEVVARIIERENAHEQGRRYGHPVLDIAREINRYLHPTVRGAGGNKTDTAAIKQQAIAPLAALFENANDRPDNLAVRQKEFFATRR